MYLPNDLMYKNVHLQILLDLNSNECFHCISFAKGFIFAFIIKIKFCIFYFCFKAYFKIPYCIFIYMLFKY